MVDMLYVLYYCIMIIVARRHITGVVDSDAAIDSDIDSGQGPPTFVNVSIPEKSLSSETFFILLISLIWLDENLPGHIR